jgi:5'-3' exonuclease
MGLHGVSQFLRNKVPHLRHTSHISIFAHQRVFIDIASYLFKYVVVCGTESAGWLNQFMSLMLCFRKNGVIPIPVFDGPAPAAKHDEQQSRRDARNKTRDKIHETEEAIKRYEQGQTDLQTVQIIQQEIDVMLKKGFSSKPLLQRSSDSGGVNPVISKTELDDLRKHLAQLKKQVSFLSKDDYDLLEQLLNACGVTWIKAPGESEAYCCYLVRKGFGAAVVSYDTDCLAHRADTIIFDVDKQSGTITYVNTEELLHEWGLTEDQLIDFGILVGCDYNPGCRTNKIGPVKAVQLLAKHRTIEQIPDIVDYDGLKAGLCRELFTIEHDVASIVVRHHAPNFELIQHLMNAKSGINFKVVHDLATSCNVCLRVDIVESL